MDEDTLTLLPGFFNEVKYFLGCDVCLVEEDLLLLIKPVERKIYDPHAFPLVLNLLPRAINDPGDLIRDNELHILKQVMAILFLTDIVRT